MLSGKCFVVFDVFSFPAGVYIGTLNLIASIPDPSILTFYIILVITTLSLFLANIFYGVFYQLSVVVCVLVMRKTIIIS